MASQPPRVCDSSEPSKPSPQQTSTASRNGQRQRCQYTASCSQHITPNKPHRLPSWMAPLVFSALVQGRSRPSTITSTTARTPPQAAPTANPASKKRSCGGKRIKYSRQGTTSR